MVFRFTSEAIKLYDKIYLLAIMNFKKGRYRYFDDFYTAIKQNFKIHPSELENQLPRYLALWNDVKLNARCKIKTSSVEKESNLLQVYYWMGIIDPRAYNLLKHAEIYTKEAILEYYNKNGSFIGLERCGEKTNNLLVEICLGWKR